MRALLSLNCTGIIVLLHMECKLARTRVTTDECQPCQVDASSCLQLTFGFAFGFKACLAFVFASGLGLAAKTKSHVSCCVF